MLARFANVTKIQDEGGDLQQIGTVHHIVTEGNPLEIFNQDTIEYRPARPTSLVLSSTGSTTMGLVFNKVGTFTKYIVDLYKVTAGVRSIVVRGRVLTAGAGSTLSTSFTGLTASGSYQAEVFSVKVDGTVETPSLAATSLVVTTASTAQTWFSKLTTRAYNHLFLFNISGTAATDAPATIVDHTTNYTLTVNGLTATPTDRPAIIGGNLYGTGNIIRSSGLGQVLTMRALNTTTNQVNGGTEGFFINVLMKVDVTSSTSVNRIFSFINSADTNRHFRLETPGATNNKRGRFKFSPGGTAVDVIIGDGSDPAFPNDKLIFDGNVHKIGILAKNGALDIVLDGVQIRSGIVCSTTPFLFDKVAWMGHINSSDVNEGPQFSIDTDMFGITRGIVGNTASLPTVAEIIDMHNNSSSE